MQHHILAYEMHNFVKLIPRYKLLSVHYYGLASYLCN